MPASNELRLFLSSTFVDFLDERDYLAKKIFPKLRSDCRERGIEFTEIDLRWGLTDEDAEQGRILGTCFEEIDKCRPFFVGMLGDRYGWVPPPEELDKNPHLASEYPWIEAAVRNGKSATEMEFLHGFLNEGFHDTPPLIYFREPREAMDPRVARLKQEVVSRLGAIPSYCKPEELGAQIESDLSRLIEQFWPASKQSTWLDEERAGHAAFAQSRRKGYVPNPSLVDALEQHLNSSDSLLILRGESGSGKSSLLAHWADALRTRPAGERHFVIEHFVGVTAASTDPDILMRRLIEEIRERIHADEPVPQSSTELTQALPSWLGRISNEPVVILVDAINQFNTEGRFLRWLPEFSSANLKWVISSTSGDALERLRARGNANGHRWPEFEVTPISVEERRRVLRTFLAGYQKKLPVPQEDRIVQDSKSSNPLFLRTLLEELRLQGKHEDLDDLIGHYLSSRDIPELFARILERLEADYGAKYVRAFLTRVWAAPRGLSETELLGSTTLDRASVSRLLHAFDYHLVRLSGRLSFFHDHLRMGVEARYLPDQTEKINAWTELARYFEAAEASTIKALSLPWLWLRAERWPELRQALLDISLLPYLTEGSRSYDLLGYWLELEKQAELEKNNIETKVGWNIDVVREYETSLHEHPLDKQSEREIRYRLGLFFRNAGWHEGAAASAERALELCENASEETKELLDLKVQICLELGKAYLDRGNLPLAESTLRKALLLLEDGEAKAGLETTTFSLPHLNVRNEYARLLKDQGKYKDAETISRVTLEAAKRDLGPNHSATQNEMRMLADVLALEANYPEAEALHRQVLKSIEASLGPESLEAGYYLNQLADFIRTYGGSYEESQQLFGRAIKIIESRLGDHHPDLAVLMQNFGSLHAQQGHWDLAEQLFQRSLAVCEIACGLEHPMTAHCVNSYASSLYWQQKYELAEPLNRRALAIRSKYFGENHPETAVTYNNLGNTLRRLERYDEAEQCYLSALNIRLATIGPNHEDTARTLAVYGSLLHTSGNLEKSEAFLSQAYTIRKPIRGIKHSDTLSIAVELAEVLINQKKRTEASGVVEEILACAGAEDLIPERERLRERWENVRKAVQR
jgi:nephrocystin-3